MHLGIVAVHKVKPSAAVYAAPDWVQLVAGGMEDAVPAHVRHFVAAAIGLRLAVEFEFLHFAVYQAQTFGRAFFAAVEQHLQTDANAKQGFVLHRMQYSSAHA